MAVVDSNIFPVHDSKSEPPPLFDGTPRLYVSLRCPYAQRVFTARNYKGLDEIQVVPIDLGDRPSWYKEKVYPTNKVPALEHDGKVIGESLDLLVYIDNNFGGPKLIPSDPVRKQAADELIKYVETFSGTGSTTLKNPDSNVTQEFGPVLDYLENAWGKFDDGPFFLGKFSVVDCAYASFLERFHITFLEFKNYDLLEGRPKLSKYLKELNKVDAYVKTKPKPEEIIARLKTLFNLGRQKGS
eukprot:TRINITY_DN993_c0_g1_i2.p1 TRINITY_DN993_c0_g1~~TRINITY_DN993_c0_g1_i2.p1  ORF type:complete len:242 (-),score=43.94 TRINITY_DN993_c0_g1_i2:688-1413(-)